MAEFIYQVLGHCDIFSRIYRVGSISPILFYVGIKNSCMDASLDADMSRTVLVHCDLDL